MITYPNNLFMVSSGLPFFIDLSFALKGLLFAFTFIKSYAASAKYKTES